MPGNYTNNVANPQAHVGGSFGKSQKTKLHPSLGTFRKEDTCWAGLQCRIKGIFQYILSAAWLRRAASHSH